MGNIILLTSAFSDTLRTFLEAKRLTRAEFSEKYSISSSTLNRLLVGKTEGFRQDTLEKLSKVMNDKKWPQGPEVIPEIAPPRSTVSEHIADPADIVTALTRAQIPVDFKQYVSTAAYVPRGVMLFVTHYPSRMSPEQRRALQSLLEMKITRFSGLVSGHFVVYDQDADRFVERAPVMRPVMTVKEQFGKPIRRLLQAFYTDYVANRTQAEILADGLNIIALEPDISGTTVLDAWAMEGVVFDSTGCFPAGMDSTTNVVLESAPQDIRLLSKITQSGMVRLQAQSLLDNLNKPVLNLS